MHPSEEKKLLRARIKAKELSLSARYLRESGLEICRRLISMPAFRMAGSVFCFAGIRREIDTRPILEAALDLHKALYLPRCTAPGIMKLCRVNDLSELRPGAFGIPEPPEEAQSLSPDALDLAVIPCLCASRDGRRLGRGGGYYDRFLAAYPGDSILLCRDRLLWKELPVEAHDRPVPWVLTERALYEDGVPELP